MSILFINLTYIEMYGFLDYCVIVICCCVSARVLFACLFYLHYHHYLQIKSLSFFNRCMIYVGKIFTDGENKHTDTHHLVKSIHPLATFRLNI